MPVQARHGSHRHRPGRDGPARAGWTQPGADMANTRDVASAITSSNVSKLGVAWTVPLTIPTARTDGAYASTPVIVNGVVYVQDLESDVMAISLATGKVLWRHDYNSPNGGPDGVSVAGGVVYAATNSAAVALDAATGAQLWNRTLTGNDHEGIAMAPGYNHGTVYVSTVPVNATVGQYLPGGEGILWALNAKTGAPEWSWNQVQNLWGNPGVNSGGGLWYAPPPGGPPPPPPTPLWSHPPAPVPHSSQAQPDPDLLHHPPPPLYPTTCTRPPTPPATMCRDTPPSRPDTLRPPSPEKPPPTPLPPPPPHPHHPPSLPPPPATRAPPLPSPHSPSPPHAPPPPLHVPLSPTSPGRQASSPTLWAHNLVH